MAHRRKLFLDVQIFTHVKRVMTPGKISRMLFIESRGHVRSLSARDPGILPLGPASGTQGGAPWTLFGHRMQSTLARPRPADLIHQMNRGFNLETSESKAVIILSQVSRLRTAAPEARSLGRKRHTDSQYQSDFEQRAGHKIDRKDGFQNPPTVPGSPHRSNQDRETWQIQKSALSKKFGGSSWLSRKRLSPDSLEGIRTLHTEFPDTYTTPVLANLFQISPEAIRRILKSKWRPSDAEEERRRERWNKRGLSIWGRMSELGLKAPRKWRIQEKRPDNVVDGLLGQTRQQGNFGTGRESSLTPEEQKLHNIETTLKVDINSDKEMSLVDRF